MSAGELVCRLFQARTAAHMAHLQTRSFAEHKALNEFYDEVVGLADSFAETYQGIFGIIEQYPPCPLPTGKAADWINALREWCEKNRGACCQARPLWKTFLMRSLACAPVLSTSCVSWTAVLSPLSKKLLSTAAWVSGNPFTNQVKKKALRGLF